MACPLQRLGGGCGGTDHLPLRALCQGRTEDLYRKTKDDPGLYFRTKEKKHLGKFRTPSLRYTKYTAPYMHNGMLGTLRDVVEFYNNGGGRNEFAATKSPSIRPLGLTDAEMNDLVAFLESLSGNEILMETPDLPGWSRCRPRAGTARKETARGRVLSFDFATLALRYAQDERRKVSQPSS